MRTRPKLQTATTAARWVFIAWMIGTAVYGAATATQAAGRQEPVAQTTHQPAR